MIDNELRQQYRQAVDDFKIAFKETCLYIVRKSCEKIKSIKEKTSWIKN